MQKNQVENFFFILQISLDFIFNYFQQSISKINDEIKFNFIIIE